MIESPTPEIDWTASCPSVSRDSTSPVRVTSKNVGSMRITRRVDRAANVGDDALAEPRNQIETQRRERAEHDGGREERDEIAVDRRGVAARRGPGRSGSAARSATRAARAAAIEQSAERRGEQRQWGQQIGHEPRKGLNELPCGRSSGAWSHGSSVARKPEVRIVSVLAICEGSGILPAPSSVAKTPHFPQHSARHRSRIRRTHRLLQIRDDRRGNV